MRISDWSSDVCSSDLPCGAWCYRFNSGRVCRRPMDQRGKGPPSDCREYTRRLRQMPGEDRCPSCGQRSEEHTSELQSLMRISYAVFCLKKQKKKHPLTDLTNHISIQINRNQQTIDTSI